ncbi:hypothetical protein FJU08_06365 [Martelella alba]|uniref:Uncharacterized protein n=1 Tax=Martelella alba TaxID=2590451 RepID=A0A506UF04_9HYPH|nr:hypothetical protein [Martelella alba]TPW32610.1 hypothetical protein FJU08_06365 [Martelella alba]
MRLMQAIFGELYGLFVDDGWLALQVVVLVFVTLSLVDGFGLASLAGGGLLVLGCMLILLLSLRRGR